MNKGISVGRTRCLLASTLQCVLACLSFAQGSLAGAGQNVYPLPYIFKTVTENSSPHFNPTSVAVDAAGNIYFDDERKQVVCRIKPSGTVSIIAGKIGICGSSDGTGSLALFRYPHGIAIDTTGNLYVADSGNNTIRRITPDGGVTTLAGLAGVVGSNDGKGIDARFHYPLDVAADASGNIYVADAYNGTIRKVTSRGVVSTIAGQAGNLGAVDGRGLNTRFDFPASVAVDDSGNVYVADTLNNAIRKITPDGTVTTWAGTMSSTSGDADAVGNSARFCHPCGVAVDKAGNIYVADSGNQIIRRISPDRAVTTLAGLAGQSGFANRTGDAARFWYPTNLALDRPGNLYVVDEGNAMIRKGSSEIATNVNRAADLSP